MRKLINRIGYLCANLEYLVDGYLKPLLNLMLHTIGLLLCLILLLILLRALTTIW